VKPTASINRVRVIWTLLLAVYTAVFFAMPINLSNADLGRHIANGAMLLQGTTEVLYTNFYSFTEPGHTFTNHHWGSGVVMYAVHAMAGFEGLSIMYILLIVGCLLLMVHAVSKQVPYAWAMIFGTLIVPLFAYRTEVRPEGFSYLLMAVYYLLMVQYRASGMDFRKLLFLMLPMQLLWVNMHIFFFLGLGTVGLFWLDMLLVQRDREKASELLKLLVAMVSISLVNPHFHRGLLAPLTIFDEYGYMIVENQTVFFLQERFGNPRFIHLEILSVFTFGSVVWAIVRGEWRRMMPEMVLASGYLALSFMAVRGIPMFALFSIPIFARVGHGLSLDLDFRTRGTVERLLPIIGILLCIIFTPTKGTYASANKGYNGIGLVSGIHRTGRFIQKSGIPGRIFNNYDIGSYLIYFLQDSGRVFVDNRPEAYSVAFFDSIYQPMQEDDDFFRQMVERYDLNVICFYRHDATEWGQPFLIRRTQDPEWIPILVDEVALVLIRNVPSNQRWIAQYALPRSMFQAVRN